MRTSVGGPIIGAALFAAMVVTMASAGLMGAAVPLMLKAVRLDPALIGPVTRHDHPTADRRRR